MEKSLQGGNKPMAMDLPVEPMVGYPSPILALPDLAGKS
jgi:hypothetical protein